MINDPKMMSFSSVKIIPMMMMMMMIEVGFFPSRELFFNSKKI